MLSDRLGLIHPMMVGELAEATSGALAVTSLMSREWKRSEDCKRPNILAIRTNKQKDLRNTGQPVLLLQLI